MVQASDNPEGGGERDRSGTDTGERQRERIQRGPAAAERRLSAINLLSSLSPETLRKCESSCEWHNYRPGATILERGQNGDEVFFLLDGVAQVLSFSDSGRAVSFALLQKGDYFGELAAIDQKPRSATVIAKTDCLTARLPADAFIELITTYPPIVLSVLRKLAGVVRASDDRILDLSVLDAEQRICVELLRLAKPNPASAGGPHEIYPVPTQKSLSREIGVTRETVARIFSRLTGEGIIQRKSNVLYILDTKKLEQLVVMEKSAKLKDL